MVFLRILLILVAFVTIAVLASIFSVNKHDTLISIVTDLEGDLKRVSSSRMGTLLDIVNVLSRSVSASRQRLAKDVANAVSASSSGAVDTSKIMDMLKANGADDDAEVRGLSEELIRQSAEYDGIAEAYSKYRYDLKSFESNAINMWLISFFSKSRNLVMRVPELKGDVEKGLNTITMNMQQDKERQDYARHPQSGVPKMQYGERKYFSDEELEAHREQMQAEGRDILGMVVVSRDEDATDEQVVSDDESVAASGSQSSEQGRISDNREPSSSSSRSRSKGRNASSGQWLG